MPPESSYSLLLMEAVSSVIRCVNWYGQILPKKSRLCSVWLKWSQAYVACPPFEVLLGHKELFCHWGTHKID